MLSRMQRSCIMGMIACSVVAPAVLSASPTDDEMISLARVASRQAALAVASAKGKITVREWYVKRPAGAGNAAAVVESERVYQLSFSGSKYRLSTEGTILKNDSVPGAHATPVGTKSLKELAFDGTQVTELERVTRRATIGDSTRPRTRAAGLVNGYLREVGVSGGNVPGSGFIDLGQLESNFQSPAYSTTTSVVGRETLDGAECVLVELVALSSSKQISNRTIDIWFDSQKGFTTRRVRAFYEGGPYSVKTLSAEANVQLKEYCPGVWFPEGVSQDFYRLDEQGKPYKYRNKTITYAPDFQLNVPVPQEALSLALPSGTRVYNETLEARYTVP